MKSATPAAVAPLSTAVAAAAPVLFAHGVEGFELFRGENVGEGRAVFSSPGLPFFPTGFAMGLSFRVAPRLALFPGRALSSAGVAFAATLRTKRPELLDLGVAEAEALLHPLKAAFLALSPAGLTQLLEPLHLCFAEDRFDPGLELFPDGPPGLACFPSTPGHGASQLPHALPTGLEDLAHLLALVAVEFQRRRHFLEAGFRPGFALFRAHALVAAMAIAAAPLGGALGGGEGRSTEEQGEGENEAAVHGSGFLPRTASGPRYRKRGISEANLNPARKFWGWL